MSTKPETDPQLVHLAGPLQLDALIAVQGELQEQGIEAFSDDGEDRMLTDTITGTWGSPFAGHVYVRASDRERGVEIVEAVVERWHGESEAKAKTCPNCGCSEGRRLRRPGCGGCLAIALLAMLLTIGLAAWSPVATILVPLELCWLYHRLARYAYACPECTAKWR